MVRGPKNLGVVSRPYMLQGDRSGGLCGGFRGSGFRVRVLRRLQGFTVQGIVEQQECFRVAEIMTLKPKILIT